jgi:hypothetical protein
MGDCNDCLITILWVFFDINQLIKKIIVWARFTKRNESLKQNSVCAKCKTGQQRALYLLGEESYLEL